MPKITHFCENKSGFIDSKFVVRCHELVNVWEFPPYPKFTAGPGVALTTNPQLLLFMREERVNDPTM